MPGPPYIPSTAPFTPEQRAWINGYLAGLFSDANQGEADPAVSLDKSAAQPEPLLVLYGSQTGSAEQLAKRVAADARKRGFSPRLLEMNAVAPDNLKQESRLVIVTSTWGDGDPPDNAQNFWAQLRSEQAPRLEQLHFSVLALGDRNYPDFCGAGRKLDARLESLGARRIHPRTDCDTDYEEPARAWIDGLWPALQACGTGAGGAVVSGSVINESVIRNGAGSDSPKGETPALASATTSTTFSRNHPFPARLVTNRRLNAPGSAKDTRHFEISLTDSDLHYEVGDALGVVPTNCPALVGEILRALDCDGEEAVRDAQGREISLRHALLRNCQITQPSNDMLQAVVERSNDAPLRSMLEPGRKADLDAYLYGREVIDLLLQFPMVKFAPAEFVALLRKLQPRLYSISSSPKAHPEEVHLTVAAVRYQSHGRLRHGVCSTFLADRVDHGTPVPVFVQVSPGFRLPKDGDTPVIMIGPGTGIAPFRAFLEERRAMGAKGRNWLFFGDQQAANDFLYREQLEGMLAEGSLNRLETAFSRDQADKIYVQHRMRESATELWAWLEEGAHLYVCGDARRMARDVDAALHEIIQTTGGRDPEQAAGYVTRLKAAKRYQRDVY